MFRSIAALAAITITLALAPAVGAARPGGCQLPPGNTTVNWISFLGEVETVDIRWFDETGQIEQVILDVGRGRPFYTQPTPAGTVEFGVDFLDANGNSLGVTGGTCQP